jgi:hypothetical protein
VEDRVERVRVVDVVEHHRTALSGDAAGEPFPEWDANALGNLLLRADCSSGDELPSRFVEQEDGGGVSLE